MRPTSALVAVAALSCGLVGACDSSDAEPTTSTTSPTSPTSTIDESEADRFPTIVEATANQDEASGLWTFDVTVSSPYDTPERYADGWRVIGPDGTVYGTHTLTHDHANEQPFTRRQSGVSIPADVTRVTIEGRDQSNGFGGRTVQIDLQTG